MKGIVVVSTLILILARQVAESRWIRDEVVVESTVTCEATYGFLPCSTSVWGLLFLIVVYNILLSMAGQYVGKGSDLFFQIIGPGVVGGSVFQFLGSIPRLIVLLVPLLTGSEEEAQERASAGMGMVLGGVAILLTLIWGLTVIFGSYDQSQDDDDDDSESQITTVTGSAVVTDIETSWTARLILLASVPFLILEFQYLFTSQSAKRVVILIALIVTIILLTAYVVYQSFSPWIQNRCFEYMMDTYAKDKLLKLISSYGRPDTKKIQQLFNKIAKGNSESVTAAEIRVLALGIKMDDEDTATEQYLDRITAYFDTTGDGVISRDEFIKGMINLASSLLDDQIPSNNKAQLNDSEEQESLLGSSTRQRGSNSWGIYLRASWFLIFGTGMAYVLSEPLVSSMISLANAANIPSFWISYCVLPIALNYNGILQSVASALQKDKKTNSLTLSSLYGRVLMNNMMGLIPFLAPVYFRNLSSDVSAELLLVLTICVVMGLFTSFNTTFPRWAGFVVLSLYPISLLSLYLLTAVLGWS